MDCYTVLMQCIATTGQIAAGLALLGRVEASGLPYSDVACYGVFRTLGEACHAVRSSDSASQVQAAADRLGLIALAPVATALVQGWERQYRNGVNGEGVTD